MINTTKIITLLLVLTLTSCKKPLDYYNKAVYAGNMAISLTEVESRIERIQEGYEPEPIDLVSRMQMRLATNENYLEELRGFLGNKETDAMINSAIAYLENDLSNARNPKTIELLNAIDQKLTPDALEQVLEHYEDHLDLVYDTKTELWNTYDMEVTKYAKANDIEEHFYGPNLQPVETKSD